MRKFLKYLIVFLIVVVVLVASIISALLLDLTSYGATSIETLTPENAPIGRALVLFDPGFSGAARLDAARIAEELQANGYTVDLAGVRNGIAENNSGYDIIVAGGPMYWSQACSSIDAYLKTVPTNANLGVFVSTGTSTYMESDFLSLQKQVTSNGFNGNVAVKLILDGNEKNDCAELVSKLVKQG